MQAVFESCRWLNQYLGIIGCVCVLWRLVPLLLERGRWSDPAMRHRILVFSLLAGYEVMTAIGAARGVGLSDVIPAIWTSAVFTLLHTSAICLCVWWPHPARLSRD